MPKSSFAFSPRFTPVSFSFNANGDAFFVAREAMTLGNAREAGTGTLSYTKALAADTATFSAATLPVSLAVGDVLKVTLASTTSYKSLTLERTA